MTGRVNRDPESRMPFIKEYSSLDLKLRSNRVVEYCMTKDICDLIYVEVRAQITPIMTALISL